MGHRMRAATAFTATYARLGPLNFRNELEPQSSGGTRFGLGRTGPRLTGRAYIGLHRRFH